MSKCTKYLKGVAASTWIAIIAVILSQSPKIVDWIPNEKFEVRPATSMIIVNNYGTTGLYWMLDFDNQGNQEIKLSSAKLVLTYEDGESETLNALAFVDVDYDGIANMQYPFKLARVTPHRSRSAYIHFGHLPTVELDAKISELQMMQRPNRLATETSKTKEIETKIKELESKTKKLVDSNLKWKQGEYTVQIEVTTLSGVVYKTPSMKFTIHKHKLDNIKTNSTAEHLSTELGITTLQYSTQVNVVVPN